MLGCSPYFIIWVQFIQHPTTLILSCIAYLSGDIQSDPGPVPRVTSLNVCTLNLRSFTNPLHYTAWHRCLLPNTTSAQLFDAIPRGFTVISTSRLVPHSCTSLIVGGGTAFLLCEPCKFLSCTPTKILLNTFKSFELSTVKPLRYLGIPCLSLCF